MGLQARRQHSGKRIIVTLTMVLVVMAVARSSIGTYSVIEGDSMHPTFKPGDVVHSTSPSGNPLRGDVVIITDDRGDRAIKRVIGLPGETVTVYRGFVYVNGQRLNEPYLPPKTYSFESNSRIVRRIDWRVPAQHYFVMGDNRSASTDSRKFGPVSRGNIHETVESPANTPRPEFSDIFLTPASTTTLASK